MGLHQTYLAATAQRQDKNNGTTDIPQGYSISIHASIIDFIFKMSGKHDILSKFRLYSEIAGKEWLYLILVFNLKEVIFLLWI